MQFIVRARAHTHTHSLSHSHKSKALQKGNSQKSEEKGRNTHTHTPSKQRSAERQRCPVPGITIPRRASSNNGNSIGLNTRPCISARIDIKSSPRSLIGQEPMWDNILPGREGVSGISEEVRVRCINQIGTGQSRTIVLRRNPGRASNFPNGGRHTSGAGNIGGDEVQISTGTRVCPGPPLGKEVSLAAEFNTTHPGWKVVVTKTLDLNVDLSRTDSLAIAGGSRYTRGRGVACFADVRWCHLHSYALYSRCDIASNNLVHSSRCGTGWTVDITYTCAVCDIAHFWSAACIVRRIIQKGVIKLVIEIPISWLAPPWSEVAVLTVTDMAASASVWPALVCAWAATFVTETHVSSLTFRTLAGGWAEGTLACSKREKRQNNNRVENHDEVEEFVCVSSLRDLFWRESVSFQLVPVSVFIKWMEVWHLWAAVARKLGYRPWVTTNAREHLLIYEHESFSDLRAYGSR